MSGFIKTSEELQILREGGAILTRVLDVVEKSVRPGITTRELNDIAERETRARGAEPSFLHYRAPGAGGKKYPAALCTSVNFQIVHAVPSSYILKEGDIVKVDYGVKFKGMFTDAARSVLVGPAKNPRLKKLIQVTQKALLLGIKEARPGHTLGDVGYAIQHHLEKNDFGVVRELVGHGVGYAVHEDPNVPNYGRRGQGMRLESGMVLAIEPMATLGSPKIVLGSDGFAFETADMSLASHVEHTIIIGEKGAEIIAS